MSGYGLLLVGFVVAVFSVFGLGFVFCLGFSLVG